MSGILIIWPNYRDGIHCPDHRKIICVELWIICALMDCERLGKDAVKGIEVFAFSAGEVRSYH